MKTKILLAVFFLVVNLPVFATVWKITNSGYTYTPNAITINHGDTVVFSIYGTHDVKEVSKATWDSNGNSLLYLGFTTPFGGGTLLPEKLKVGTHYYVCTPHASMGMKGTIIVMPLTGIKENQLQAEVSVFPNPVMDNLNIGVASKMIGSRFVIADQTGRMVLSGRLENESTPLNISSFSPGMYFLQLGTDSRQRIKVIKK